MSIEELLLKIDDGDNQEIHAEILRQVNSLKAEIESLKCCGNCKHDNDTPTDTAEDHYCYDCENNNKWEKRL